MALPLHIPLLLLAALVLSLAMTPTALKSSTKRLPLVGEMEDGDINDKEVQNIVDFTLREYNNDNNDLNLSSLVRVLRARQQVVGGMNYYLDLEIGRTTCVKNRSNQVNCPLSEEPTQLCSFVVYSRSWEDYTVLTKSRCRKA
ncbi:PREDICTED: cystatin-C-like [Chinchilla lanigera]|uniref:Cystatin-C-like n=1 Tax=Chinchilla lanigera TaxID=34839 RepID=A0A8C2W2W0_CHILA|nr:PREDICTED: cystatin-C-like [Chinchilla lanigera]